VGTQVSDCVRARRCTAIAPVTTPWGREAAPGPSAAHSCTKDDQAGRTAAPGPSRTCASCEASGLGARNLWWRQETAAEDDAEWTRCQPQPGRPRAAPAAHSSPSSSSLPDAHERDWWRSPSHPGPTRQPPASAARAGAVLTGGNDVPRRHDRAAGAARALPGCGWPMARPPRVRWPSSPSTSSYMRPAPWPPSMHKCARAPALPYGPRSRPLCTLVQRWDPTLPRAPTLSSWVHACAAAGAHAVTHTRAHAAPMERVARHARLALSTKPG
jgi:hypothetical protein